MTGGWFEWAIIAFIVFAIAFVVWKGGAANPMGTGRLSRKVGHLSGDVSNLSIRVGHVETELDELKNTAATKADIATVRAEIAGLTALVNRSASGIERIERLFIEKGVNGK